MTTVTSKKELAQAVERGESRIEVIGDFANGVVKLKLIGPIAWGIAAAAIGGAVYLYMATPAATATTAGTGGVISFGAASTSAAAAVTVLGLNATTVAIGIGIAAGGVGVLTKIRDNYKIVEKSNNRVVLERKS